LLYQLSYLGGELNSLGFARELERDQRHLERMDDQRSAELWSTRSGSAAGSCSRPRSRVLFGTEV